MIDFTLVEGVSAVAIIIAVIEIVKRVFKMDTKYSPVVAIVLGVALSLTHTYFGTEQLFEAIVMGIATALSAVGLYSGTKNTIEKLKS